MNPSEARLLETIDARPDDTVARRRYAEWLEEQGERDKAEFLRVQMTLRDSSLDPAQLGEVARHFQALLRRVDVRWRARVAQRRLKQCTFVLECPLEWSALHPTDDPTVRRCDACQRQVHYCTTLDELGRRADAGECVAVDPALERAQDDGPVPLEILPQPTMGIVMRPEPPSLWQRFKRWFGV